MQKTVSLKQNSEFHRVYYKGKSRVCPVLVTYAMKSRGHGCRIGITTSKKIGSAVERNRCRRIIRAAYASLASDTAGDWDIVFIARHRTKHVKTPEVESAMRRHLTELGVIRSI